MATAVLQLESFARESATAHWRALLNGDARQQAWTVVHEIAAALAAAAPVHGVPPSSVSQSLRDEWPLQKLFFWKAEAALFYAYLEQAGGAAEFAGLSYAYLNAAIDEAAAQPSNLHLRDGLTKIGWVLAHFARLRHFVNTAESCAALDEVLHEQLSQADWQGSYDLGTGLAGYGVYALERGPEAAPLAVKVFHWLQQTAEHQPEGTTWQMQAAWWPKEVARRLPESFYCLGMAHGVPGVIGLLAQVEPLAEIAAPARELLAGAVRWLLAHQRYDEHGAYFPTGLGPGFDTAPALQAWCYGELGAGAALLSAARSAAQPEWEQAALELLRAGVPRRLAATEEHEPGLCHGSAGQAHLYNRIYQATGEELFKEAALHWYQRTFEHRRPGQGLAGFQIRYGVETPVGCPSLPEGVAGIGLALLAAVTEVEPGWDRLLLMTVPPR